MKGRRKPEGSGPREVFAGPGPACRPEILAPAGGEESLVAAVRSGADAVYLGGKSLNARRGAANFDGAALAEAVRYCHVRGVRVYLTLNTLVFDAERPALLQALEEACAAGVDALIVQDLAVARLARECAPTLPLHASTQMSIHDAAGAQVLSELGFSRVVLARELSREEIAAIRAGSDIELECFVHGALCMCVSGQCYLSSMIGGRSGNRGMCAQPCRLPFAAGGRQHVLSLKDLSLIEHAPELAALGVRSLKIEGRMKRPEYVAAAVTACRQALAGETPDYEALEAVFSRAGFTDGYYEGKRGDAMFGIRRHEDVQSAAPVLRRLAGLYKDERRSVPLALSLSLREGQPASLTARDADGNAVTAIAEPPQPARTAPTTPEKAAVSLEKTGGTPYLVRHIDADIGEGLMLPAAQLNALRRDVLEGLTALRGEPRLHPFAPPQPSHPQRRDKSTAPVLRARLSRAAQLTDALMQQVQEATFPLGEAHVLPEEAYARYRGRLLIEIPGILFRADTASEAIQYAKERGVTDAMVGGLGSIAIAREHGLAPHGDYGLNIANTLAAEEYARLGLQDFTASLELQRAQLLALGGELPRGILAYGYLPLMTVRNCPGRAEPCTSDRGCGFPEVTDRRGNRFFVDCDWGVPRLYNCVPLVLSNRLAEWRGIDFLTLYFTRESPQQCVEVARLYREGGSWDGERTRGLYYRKVQ